jgi:hypothetical protein
MRLTWSSVGDQPDAIVPLILRIGVAGCYIGHGAFGLMTKAAWLPYFAVGGIDAPTAWQLMPMVGLLDVCIGLLALFWPCRALFLWALVWAVFTALLRPLAGEPFWEALERAGNYGVPLAMIALVGLKGPWWVRLTGRESGLLADQREAVVWSLRLVTFTLLAGHAGLGLFAHKAGLGQHYAALEIADAAAAIPSVGLFEFALAFAVLVRPGPALLLTVVGWKLATESLFLVAGASGWEVIERFGSYTAPLALAWLLRQPSPDTGRVVPAHQ